MKISRKFSHWFIALLLVAFFSVAATVLQQAVSQKHQNAYIIDNASAQVIYGQDGKPDGQLLESTPQKITEEYIYFNDRVLLRYNYDAQSIDYTVETINTVFDWVPDYINKYFLAAPMRIAVEESIETNDGADSAKALDEICDSLSSEVHTINTLNTLSEHADEYIFFRTDRSWTSLGAYYAAEEFLASKDITIIPLKDYYDEMNQGYVGILGYLSGTESLLDYPDLVYFYTLKGSSNSQNITAYDNKEYKEYTSPVIASSRGGTDIFIGEYFSHTIIDGDKDDSDSIIIMGDKYSKLLSPWLIPYYNKVILINPTFFKGDVNAIAQMIHSYNVKDFLVVECQSTIGESIYNSKMYSLFETQKKREEE